MRARLAASGEADDAQRRRWGRVVTDWVANEKTTTIYIKTYPRGGGEGVWLSTRPFAGSWGYLYGEINRESEPKGL